VYIEMPGQVVQSWLYPSEQFAITRQGAGFVS
jgi:hypothetical protein